MKNLKTLKIKMRKDSVKGLLLIGFAVGVISTLLMHWLMQYDVFTVQILPIMIGVLYIVWYIERNARDLKKNKD